MADFFFFTDTDLLNNQSSGEEFGPAGTVTEGGTNYDAYRTTSVHTASADPKAYAVTKGQVFIQDVDNPTTGGPDLVNLILQPEFQPEFNLPYIKFYIYKGIKKDSLINATTNEVASASTNDLTAKIWDAQNKRNLEIEELTGTNPNETPSEKALGIQYTGTASGNEQILDDEPLGNNLYVTAAEPGLREESYNYARSLRNILPTMSNAQWVSINQYAFDLNFLIWTYMAPIDQFSYDQNPRIQIQADVITLVFPNRTIKLKARIYFLRRRMMNAAIGF